MKSTTAQSGRAAHAVRGVVVLLALAGSCASVGQPAPVKGEVDRWLAQLASDDWKLRRQATDGLIALGADALPRLAELAERTADDEVRARAQAAMRQIEDDRQTGMSLVTLRLTNVSAAEAFAEVARQAGGPLAADPPDLLRKITKPVSLTAERRPFWQVMQSLSAQTELEVTGITRHNRELGLGVTRGDADWMDKPIVLAGPLLIRADRLTRVSTISLKFPREAGREFAISLTVFAEPKLKVLDFSQAVRLDEATDEKGNSLIPPHDPDGVPANADVFGNHREGYTSRWDVGATLHHPKGAGTRIDRLRGSTTLLVETRSAVLDLPLAGARNVTRTLEGLRVTVKSVDGSRAELSVHRDARGDAEWYAVRTQLTAGEARLLDDRGHTVARSAGGGTEVEEGAENGRLDLRLRLVKEAADGGREARDGRRKATSEAARFVWEFPVDARELVVPFEFRGLPIP